MLTAGVGVAGGASGVAALGGGRWSAEVPGLLPLAGAHLAVDALSGLFMAVAGAVVRYAHAQAAVAREQLAFSERVQREASEPYVVVDIQPQEPDAFMFVLTVENIGPTVARSVKVSVTPDLTSTVSDVSEDLRTALARTIPVLPPGRRLDYLFDTAKRFHSELDMVFEFTVTSTGPAGPVETLRYTIDLNVYSESLMGSRPFDRIEEHLAKLSSRLKTLTDYYATANGEAIASRRQAELDAARTRSPQRNRGGSTEPSDGQPGNS